MEVTNHDPMYCPRVVVARADHCHFAPGSRTAAAVLVVPQTAVLDIVR